MSARSIAPVILLVGIATFLGVAIAGVLPLPQSLRFPGVAILAILLPLLLLPLLVSSWSLALTLLLGWFVLEDLIRKLAGNDILIYFIKDFIFLIVLLSLVLSPEVRGIWKRATGKQRVFLYMLIAWALVMAVPAVAEDWRLPLIGLRLDFMYMPLVIPGFLIGSNNNRLRSWLYGLTILGVAACLVGIIQATIGPEFLAPDRPTPELRNLVTTRGLDGNVVVRPSGTFVSTGRFASMALIAFAISLGGALLKGRRDLRFVALVGVIVSGSAVWVSGGRAGFIAALALVALALLAPRMTRSSGVSIRLSAAIMTGFLAIAFVGAFSQSLVDTREAWYERTLNPRSSSNQWASRWNSLWGDTIRGVKTGGFLGQGTGTESLGQQYLTGEIEQSQTSLYEVEGGYASVAIEWGIVGLVLWLAWTLSWTFRQWRCLKEARGSPVAGTNFILFGWILFSLFIGFFAGLQGFQNYLSNAYLWLFSGILFASPLAKGGSRAMEGGLDEA